MIDVIKAQILKVDFPWLSFGPTNAKLSVGFVGPVSLVGLMSLLSLASLAISG